MKIILLIFLSLASISHPALSHGSKDDCSSECNDYYCPPEKENVKKNKFSESGLLND